jgi:mevalonate kinase
MELVRTIKGEIDNAISSSKTIVTYLRNSCEKVLAGKSTDTQKSVIAALDSIARTIELLTNKEKLTKNFASVNKAINRELKLWINLLAIIMKNKDKLNVKDKSAATKIIQEINQHNNNSRRNNLLEKLR